MLFLGEKIFREKMVPDGVEITENARYFYAMTQSVSLAVLVIMFVPLHFGTD
jgi:hypothetical protein